MPTLSSVAELIMGQSPPSDTYNDRGEGLPFYQGKTDFGFKYPFPRLYCSSPKKVAEVGDILISVRAPVGPTNIASEKSCIGRGLGAIRAQTIDSEFLYFNLKYIEPYIASLGTGSTFTAINKNQLANLEVNQSGFEISEQLRITHVLTTVQNAIEKQTKLIELTREFKSALMKKLFTEGLHNEKQKKTEIGLVPESWEVVSVDDLGEVITGRTPSTKHPEYYEGEYKLISPADLDIGKYVRSAHRTLSKEGFEQCRGLPKETVLVGCIGNVGKIGMTDDDKSATNQQINSIICNNSYNPHFVYYCLQFNRKRLENIAAKVTVPIVNKSNFEDFKIASPKKNQQDEVAHMFTVLDDKVENLEKKKNVLEELFRTLLHQLMTGQIRTNKIDITGL